MRFLAPHQTGGVEEADCNDRNDDEENDGAAVGLAQSRPKCPENEDDPQQQSDRKIDLPNASQVDILPSLMTKPVVDVEVRDEAVHRGPLSDEAANDNYEQAAKQEVDAQNLKFWVFFDNRGPT